MVCVCYELNLMLRLLSIISKLFLNSGIQMLEKKKVLVRESNTKIVLLFIGIILSHRMQSQLRPMKKLSNQTYTLGGLRTGKLTYRA